MGAALRFIGAIGIFATSFAGSCSEEQRPPVTPNEPIRAAALPEADVRLLLLTDLDGYLEPCGCTSRPLGGIDRLAARARELTDEGPPTAMVAAGNIFFHGAPHGADADRAAAQERLRAEAAVAILDRIDLAAATPGPLDFGYGTEQFEALARRADFPLLAAGVTRENPEPSDGEGADTEDIPPPIVATAQRRIGQTTVGFLGVADLSLEGRAPDRLTLPINLLEEAERAASSLRDGGAELIVALVTADRRTARRIATRVQAIDVVVHGGPDQADVTPPSELETAAFVNAGRQGQGLVVLDLWRRDGESWTDASIWTREERRTHLTTQIDALREQISDWEQDPDVAATDLARQRGRLAELRRDVRALAAPPPTTGNVFVARYEELGPEAEREVEITSMMRALDRRVNDYNRQAFADWAPEAPDAGQPHYVGSATCGSCHAAALAWWRETPHGHAYATLEERHKNFNLSCVGCHVTGYLRPGGSTVTHVENLQDVGCENCHGPGSQHVSNPQGASVNVQRDAPESLCVRCHNEEHSDRFVYDVYRRMLIAPGHGAD